MSCFSRFGSAAARCLKASEDAFDFDDPAGWRLTRSSGRGGGPATYRGINGETGSSTAIEASSGTNGR